MCPSVWDTFLTSMLGHSALNSTALQPMEGRLQAAALGQALPGMVFYFPNVNSVFLNIFQLSFFRAGFIFQALKKLNLSCYEIIVSITCHKITIFVTESMDI